MGTITRTFANNITTSGVFKPTAFNNASFDNVTSVPSGSLPASGNMVLLSTQTASSSTSVSFTSGIDSTYKEYLFIFYSIHPQTDGVNFTFNLSTDGGSNYNVTKTSTFFFGYNTEAGGNGLSYDAASDLAQSTSYQLLDWDPTVGLSSDADHGASGYLHLFNPSSTTYVKHFIAEISETHKNDGNFHNFIGGYGNTTSAINAIDFKISSGVFDGTIQMFGIL